MDLAMRMTMKLAGLWLAFGVTGIGGAGKKPLFEYDDHYVMLNDFARNAFYERALAAALPACGKGCSVLDVGAGSGLLSIMAAGHGAAHVFAIEANPDLAELAERTIERNQRNFPGANVTVVSQLSSRVQFSQLAQGRRADLLVTETFGTILLGEGALNFVPDARDRLLKEGGVMIPAGGCQYVTLIQDTDLSATWQPPEWHGFNLSHLRVLQDTVYWKAMVGAQKTSYQHLTERICVLEVDLYEDTSDSVPKNRTFRIQAKASGTIQAALFDWDIWSDVQRTEVLSTAPGSRNFAGDVAWGWLLQLQEEAGPDWKLGKRPSQLRVEAGDWIDLAIEFIARGISIHARARRADSPATVEGGAKDGARDGTMPWEVGSPSRIHSVDRRSMREANDFFLPVAGDRERHNFYASGIDAAVAELSRRNASKKSTLLDCSGTALPAFHAAQKHGMKSLAMPRWTHIGDVLKQVAQDNHLNRSVVEVFAADPREMFDILMPEGKRADIVVVEPPGTPLHGLSPFAVLPTVRKELLEADGLVVPGRACLELGLVESVELAHLFSVPGGSWDKVDLTVWNEEARRRGVLTRLVPYTKWLGSHSTLKHRWLSKPVCVFHVDLNEYAKVQPPPEETLSHDLEIHVDGLAHAVVTRWAVFSSGAEKLDAESDYLGRELTWPHYVQALAAPGTGPGVLDPIPVRAGEAQQLKLTVKQGSAKVTGSAGPEFTIRIVGADVGESEISSGKVPEVARVDDGTVGSKASEL
ncbi:unnamed protein product [Polarella glacialis]|uniref:Protein arginine N-methyltransferase n=1 Tax=Polarella glacialis TaxID=89957 RepID=A0A813GCU5_POLGL|nr:unnamed protein product [Polarella glacialis]